MTRNSGLAGTALLLGSILSLLVPSCDGVPLEEGNHGNASGEETPGVGTAVATSVTDPMRARPQDRLTTAIDVQDRVALAGHVHPMARAEFEVGLASPDHRMENMLLVLRPDVAQEQALEALIRAQHDPTSPLHHQWLSPEMYAERFGISTSDVASTTKWLRSHGMVIEQVVNGGRQILFSGTASQVEAAFNTSMRTYQVDGEIHHANATDPEIPRALSGVVSGVVSLHDFRAKPANLHVQLTTPENTWYYNGYQQSALVPGDLAKIYNALPLYSSSIDGTGQSIAVIGRSNINLAEVRTFRSSYGLPAKDPQIILAGTDPGIVCGGDEFESYLDVEYAGAIAKNATVKFVVARSTLATDGIYLASQYAVSHNVAPIVSLSYGLCERVLGTSGNAFMASLWQQAVAQGMSVFVASMDSGAAGCDKMDAAVATGGLGVNGLASTLFNTAVGGTQFNDVFNRSTYWAATNDPITKASALGYIPELTWNESRGGGLYSSGGGMSTLYAKPTWQFGLGVAQDGKRDIPDVAFASGIQDAYKINVDKQVMGGGGTSAATPVFASIMALVLQKVGQPQGLVNPVLYALAYNQNYNGGAAVFHDVTQGNNTVPGVTGYSAGPGFDMATGLGSVDATQLVNHWKEGTALPDFQIAAASPSASVLPAGSTTAAFTVKTNNGMSAAIKFSVTGLPTGVTGTFSPATLSASGSTTLTLVAAANAAPGVYTATIAGTSGSTSHSAALSLTVVNAPPLALTLSSSSVDIAAGSSGTAKITTTKNTAFNAAVNLSVSGAPSGVTIKLSAASIAAPGAGTSTLTATVAATTAGGTYPVTVAATGGGVTKTALLAINVLPAPSFSLTLSPTSLTVAPGAHANTIATTLRTTTFNAAVNVNVTGMPTGVTASSGTIPAPGSGISTLAITVGSTASAGTYALAVTATGGGVTKTSTLTLLVPGVALSSSSNTLTLKRGSTAMTNVTVAMQGGLSSSVTFAVQGLPAGVSATFVPASLAAPGNGSAAVKFSATSTATIGSAQVTLKATAGSATRTLSVALSVTK
jgi:subtilase family serine protease